MFHTAKERDEYFAGLMAWINRPESPAERSERERREREHQQRYAAAEAEIARLGKPYPLYVCRECCRVVGWLGHWRREEGPPSTCFDCLTSGPYGPGQVEWEPVYDPLLAHGWLPNSRDQAKIISALGRLSGRRPSLWARLLRLVGYGRPYEVRALKEWRRGVAGWPEEPPMSAWKSDSFYLLRLPEKTEVKAPDESGYLVVFRAGWYDFRGGRWLRRERGPYSGTPHDVPAVFSASLPIEQLVAAFEDFKVALERENYEDWRRNVEYEREDQERLALEAEQRRLAAERDQAERGVSKLF